MKKITVRLMSVFHILFYPEGRVNRWQYWVCMVLVNVVLIGGFPLLKAVSHFRIVFQGLYLVLGAYLNIVLNVKRCHDRDRSGLFVFLLFVPVLNLWYLFEVGFMPGTREKNRFDLDLLNYEPVRKGEILPEEILCPACGAGLRLNIIERQEMRFTCLKCYEEFVVEKRTAKTDDPKYFGAGDRRKRNPHSQREHACS